VPERTARSTKDWRGIVLRRGVQTTDLTPGMATRTDGLDVRHGRAMC